MFDWKFNLKFADCEVELEDISGWFKNNDGGPYLQKFQHKYAKFCGARHAFGVSSGSASIYIALKACGIGEGHHVAVPAYTHIGTVAPVVLAGARPVFVDVDEYGNLDPSDLDSMKGKIKKDGKNIDAVIAVHQLGLPCKMDEIIEVSDGTFIIEDASHSLGAEYKGKQVGTLGDIGCFSVGGGRTKIIGVGEGGMITTNNDSLAEKCKNIRNHGDRNTDVDYFCFNFRMSDLNAAIGYMMMDRVPFLIDWQIKNAEYIIENLPDYFDVLPTPGDVKTIRYIIGCGYRGRSRDGFLSQLNRFQIGPRQFVGGGYTKLVSDVLFYTHFAKYSDLTMSKRLRDESVWIDYHRYPRTKTEIDDLLNVLRSFPSQ
ncbi:DegT/DnrJ/EryC1/StrS family aminotransferase [Patescibacteria group bacterium]|nr:DegT/DnrJ/EryC1/StrS family aminotransferase [Patescibacteria group bacterium]